MLSAGRGKVRLVQSQPAAALDAGWQRTCRLGHGDRHLGSDADIGPGTYTWMTQLAAEMLGVPIENVTAKLGDSALPDAPVEGGSFTVSSVGSAIHAACRAVQKELLGLAQEMARSPLAGAKLDDVVFAEGKIRHKHEASREVSVADAMRAGK